MCTLGLKDAVKINNVGLCNSQSVKEMSRYIFIEQGQANKVFLSSMQLMTVHQECPKEMKCFYFVANGNL